MISRQFFWFCVNGGALGVLSLVIQALIYRSIGVHSGLAYGVASALTYLPLLVINYLIQRRWIFRRNGLFWRFVVANLSIMLLVSLSAPICRLVIARFAGDEWGDKAGFAMASVLMAIPSYFAKRLLVFTNEPHV